LRDLSAYIRALNRAFGTTELRKIQIGKLRDYQRDRSATCGPNKINQELNTLVRIMKRAGAWSRRLEEAYEPLQREQTEIRRAMTPQEQEHFLKVASERREWQFVYWYAILALRSTASNCELRGLRIGDIVAGSGVIQIAPGHAKNVHRIRTIPLPDDAQWALRRLLERAARLGAALPHHYLMPFRVAPKVHDPCRPMSNSGIKKTWNALRVAAGVPWLRIHDLRHTAITRLAEAGVPLPVILSMAGHVSQRMQQHYTAVSDVAKQRAVVAALTGGNYHVAGGRLQDAGLLSEYPSTVSSGPPVQTRREERPSRASGKLAPERQAAVAVHLPAETIFSF
jgi:integrase